MPRQYRVAFPTPKLDYYIANDTPEFELTPETSSLKAGSVYVTGKLNVRRNVTNYNNSPSGDIIDTAERVYLDPYAGVHSLFRRWNTAIAQGTLENIDEYPRLVRMIAECTMYKDDMTAESDKQMALQCGQREFGHTVLLPAVGDDPYSMPFAFRPLITINSSSADIPFRRSGMTSITTMLTPLPEAFFGLDYDDTCAYWISDLTMHYEVVPDDGNNDPITFQLFQNIPRTIESNTSNIEALVAGMSNSMACSFLQSSLLDQPFQNNYIQTCVVPNITRVQFAFNDSDNVRIAYPIENNEELELNYERSLGVEGTNSLLLSRQHRTAAYSEGFGIGISFGTIKNLTNGKFSLSIQCDPDQADSPGSLNTYRAFLYFRLLAQL